MLSVQTQLLSRNSINYAMSSCSWSWLAVLNKACQKASKYGLKFGLTSRENNLNWFLAYTLFCSLAEVVG